MENPVKSIAHSSKTALLRLTPAQLAQAHLHRRTMMQFADRFGLVYFGSVDQRDDDHQLIRGLTVSATHRDDNYCIGTYDNYDVMSVERTDTLHQPTKISATHHWVIMAFDLKTNYDIPHVFIGLHSHSDAFYARLFMRFAELQRLPLGIFGPHDQAFFARYSLYAAAINAVEVERLFSPELTSMLTKHFGTLTLELLDGTLYVYAEHQRLSLTLLETMLKNGLWLAQHIDERMNIIQKTPFGVAG